MLEPLDMPCGVFFFFSSRRRHTRLQGDWRFRRVLFRSDFDTPWHVRESTVFALERGVTHYTSNLGFLELRKALAAYVRKTFDAEYNPENEVLITVEIGRASCRERV